MASQYHFVLMCIKCHKCNKMGHLQAVCLGDKNTQAEKVEKTAGP